MKLTRVIAIAVIAASCGLGVGQITSAQSTTLQDAGQPAEFPPSSYTGRQYVDSKGCVYVRAGIDGNITWVPRVSRSRTTLCGQTPTFAAAPAPEVAPVQAPAKSAASAPVPQAAKVKAAPQKVLRTQAPAAQPAARPKIVQPVRVVQPPRSAPSPTAQRAATAAAPAATGGLPQQMATRKRVCEGGSAISSQYMRAPSGFTVRCGPQATSHVTRVQGTNAPRTAPRAVPAPSQGMPSVSAGASGATAITATDTQRILVVDPYTTRVAPRHVVREQRAASGGLYVPAGYKRVWTDGRLNPHRAHQTFAGKAAMELIWTNTLPRRLILADSGREVTAQYPGLVYPYTSYDAQRAAMPAATQAEAVTVSSKSRQPDPSAVTVQAASHQYVQAGVYASRAQARGAAQRLASTGLTTRLGTLTRNGTQYSLVLSGPYSTQTALDGALTKARKAGFGNATLR